MSIKKSFWGGTEIGTGQMKKKNIEINLFNPHS